MNDLVSKKVAQNCVRPALGTVFRLLNWKHSLCYIEQFEKRETKKHWPQIVISMWATSQSSRWNAFLLEWRPRDNPYTPASHMETCRIMSFKVPAPKMWFSNWKPRRRAVFWSDYCASFLIPTHPTHTPPTQKTFFYRDYHVMRRRTKNKELNHVVIFLRIQIYIFQKRSLSSIFLPKISSFCEFYCYFLIEKKSKVE